MCGEDDEFTVICSVCGEMIDEGEVVCPICGPKVSL